MVGFEPTLFLLPKQVPLARLGDTENILLEFAFVNSFVTLIPLFAPLQLENQQTVPVNRLQMLSVLGNEAL